MSDEGMAVDELLALAERVAETAATRCGNPRLRALMEELVQQLLTVADEWSRFANRESEAAFTEARRLFADGWWLFEEEVWTSDKDMYVETYLFCGSVLVGQWSHGAAETELRRILGLTKVDTSYAWSVLRFLLDLTEETVGSDPHAYQTTVPRP